MSTPISSYTDKIFDLLAKDKMKIALDELIHLFKGSPEFKEVILQSARFSDTVKQIRQGTISMEDANISKNRIRLAIMEILQELEEQYEENQLIKKEVDKMIQKSADKNNAIHIKGNENIANQNLSNSKINISINKNQDGDKA